MSDNKDFIAAYLDDSLTEQQALDLQAWLKADVANVRQFVVATAREEQLREAIVSSATFDALLLDGLPDAGVAGAQRRPAARGKLFPRAALVCTSILILVATLWFVFDRQKAKTFATLDRTNGPVLLQHDGDAEAKSLEPGAPVAAGTIVVEGDSSQAKFAFEDESTFTLSGPSELTLSGQGGNRWLLRRGVLLASISPRPDGQPLRVRTTTAEAIVLGTSFAMHATKDETFLRVSSGAVQLHRLVDNRRLKVTKHKQASASADPSRPLLSQRVSSLPEHWRADPDSSQVISWLGDWKDGEVLAAVPRTVFIKDLDIHEKHYHAGATNGFPGLVTLRETSAVRVRFRTERPLNVGLFLVTHTLSGAFSGNFEANVLHRNTPPDTSGWRTFTVPIESFHPVRVNPMPLTPGCVASTILVTSYARNVGLEVAELEVLSTQATQ